MNLSNQYVHFWSIGLNELQYVNYLDCHSHIDFGYIEKVDLNEVHPKIKDDYEYAKAKLIELGIIKKILCQLINKKVNRLFCNIVHLWYKNVARLMLIWYNVIEVKLWKN